MGGTEQIHDQETMGLNQNGKNVHWVLMENDDHGGFKPGFIDSDSDDFVEELGSESPSSSSSSDIAEEDNSSTTSSSSSLSPASSSYGPLFQLSELMSQLPIKRGLSKFYHGKSESFASLSSVKSLEDLAKKGRSCSGYSERMKACKSYGGLSLGHVDNHHNQRSISPKATITKKKSTNFRSSSTTFGSSRVSLVG